VGIRKTRLQRQGAEKTLNCNLQQGEKQKKNKGGTQPLSGMQKQPPRVVRKRRGETVTKGEGHKEREEKKGGESPPFYTLEKKAGEQLRTPKGEKRDEVAGTLFNWEEGNQGCQKEG